MKREWKEGVSGIASLSLSLSLSQSAAGLSRDSQLSPYGKSSELIATNLWVGPRPLTHMRGESMSGVEKVE